MYDINIYLLPIAMESGKKGPRTNDKGKIVPEVCPKCGAKIGVFLRGEPVYLCTNKKCRKYFGTVPFRGNESYLDTCIATEGVLNSVVIALKKFLLKISYIIKRLAMNFKRFHKYYIPGKIKDKIDSYSAQCTQFWMDSYSIPVLALKSKDIPKKLDKMLEDFEYEDEEGFVQSDYSEVPTKKVVQRMQSASKLLENAKLDSLTIADEDQQYRVSLIEKIATTQLEILKMYFKYGKNKGREGNVYDIGKEVEVEIMMV